MINRLLTTLLIFVVSFFAWYFVSSQPVTRSQVPTVSFEIPNGASLDTIISRLSREKLIRSRTAFKFTVLRLGIANKLQAGYFYLTPGMSASEVALALTKAYAKQIRVTLPEGLRAEEISAILTKAFGTIPKSNFSSPEFTRLAKRDEGRLFPETYDFAETATTEEVFAKLTSQQQKVLTDLRITDNKIVIFASLLEREAANDTEMPKVAGVIQKRLDSGWPLQIDATIQYLLGTEKCKKLDCDWWPKDITANDLRKSSLYNTYLSKGLPPTPISNPGRAALAAAAKPEITSAWFYLHDDKGQIHFADTIEQHNQNICTYLHKDCK